MNHLVATFLFLQAQQAGNNTSDDDAEEVDEEAGLNDEAIKKLKVCASITPLDACVFAQND